MEVLLKAFAIFFATMGPLDNMGPFAALTKDFTPQERRRTAIKAVGIATAIIVGFALFGDELLAFFSIQMPAFKVAGGILLLIASINLVTSGEDPEHELDKRGSSRRDIAVFPLALPLIAAPDALVAVVLQMEKASGDPMLEMGIILVAVFVNLIVLISLMTTNYIVHWLGSKGIEVLAGVVGVLLTALSVEFIIEGLAESVLFNHLTQAAAVSGVY